jgi:hypothetical protein
MNRLQTIEATMGLKKRIITAAPAVPEVPAQPQNETEEISGSTEQ